MNTNRCKDCKYFKYYDYGGNVKRCIGKPYSGTCLRKNDFHIIYADYDNCNEFEEKKDE